MKLNQQIAALVLCTLLGVSIFAGCGAAEQRPALDRIEYTNLNEVIFASPFITKFYEISFCIN